LIFAAILAVLALGPPVATFAYVTPDEEQTLLDNLSTPEAAKAMVVDLYEGTANTVVAAAPFQLRTVNGEDYLVTKAFITLSSGGQIVVGVVDDFNRQWTHAMSVSELNYFLRTGDRTVLKEPNLTIPATPQRPRRSGEGQTDTSNLDTVTIRANDVVVTTDRTNLVRLIQLNGVHNKPAIRRLFDALVQNRLAFILNPGTVISVEDSGPDGIDTISIGSSDRQYFISHTDVTEALNLGRLVN
jgi:hypothetical protein